MTIAPVTQGCASLALGYGEAAPLGLWRMEGERYPPGTAGSTVRLFRSPRMRHGARGLRGVSMRRMEGERYRRGRRAPRCGFSVRFGCAMEPAVSAVC